MWTGSRLRRKATTTYLKVLCVLLLCTPACTPTRKALLEMVRSQQGTIDSLRTTDARWRQADLNGDGVVDAEDVLAKDVDGDGVPDAVDVCADIAGGWPTRGCVDTDMDGLADSEDRCPSEAGLITDLGCPVVFAANEKYSFEELRAIMAQEHPAAYAELTQTKVVTRKVAEDHFVGAVNRPGRILYYCPAQLRELEKGEVVVTIGELMLDTVMRDRILAKVNERQRKLDKPVIGPKDLDAGEVRLADLMYVTLVDPAAAFEIERKHLRDTMRLADATELGWRWSIVPKEGRGGLTAELEIRVYALNELGNPIYSDEDVFPVKIDLKMDFWDMFWTEMGRDPKWLIATLIIPLITFLYGRWSKRSKEAPAAGGKASA